MPEAAFNQHVEHPAGDGSRESFYEFLKHAFGDKRICFAGIDHSPHERHGFRRNGESRKACGESRDAKNADRILLEGFAHMADDAAGNVFGASIGIV